MANCHCISNECNPCYYFSRLGNSVSTWCSNGELSPETVRYAYLARLGGLQATPEMPILLNSITMFTQGFSLSDGLLYLTEPGTYRAEYIIHLPESAQKNASFWLQAGSSVIPGSQVTVTAGSGTQTIVNQTVFDIVTSSLIGLYTNESFDFTTANAQDVAASLTIVRL